MLYFKDMPITTPFYKGISFHVTINSSMVWTAKETPVVTKWDMKLLLSLVLAQHISAMKLIQYIVKWWEPIWYRDMVKTYRVEVVLQVSHNNFISVRMHNWKNLLNDTHRKKLQIKFHTEICKSRNLAASNIVYTTD